MSGASGSSSMLAETGKPKNVPPRGLTGYRAPSKPPSRILRRAEPPHLSTSSEAPTTATDRGAHTARRSGWKVRSGAGSAGASESTTSASAATGWSPQMMTGLRSISATWGFSAAMRATASTMSISLRRSTAGWPRNGPSSDLEWMRSRSSATSSWSIGGIERTMSRNTSVIVPPRPKATTGPNAASRFMPIMNSRVPATISSTRTPSSSSPARSDDRSISVAHGGRALYAQNDQLCLGLVLDSGTHRLDGDRPADVGGRGDRRVLVVHDDAGGDAHAVGSQKRLGRRLVESGTPGGRFARDHGDRVFKPRLHHIAHRALPFVDL